jgi:hypothetical protein
LPVYAPALTRRNDGPYQPAKERGGAHAKARNPPGLDVYGMLLVYVGVEIMLTQAQMARNALRALGYNLSQ